MYGKKLQDRSLYGTNERITHFRDKTGREYHTVGWSNARIEREKKECGAVIVGEDNETPRELGLLIATLLSCFALIVLMASILLM